MNHFLDKNIWCTNYVGENNFAFRYFNFKIKDKFIFGAKNSYSFLFLLDGKIALSCSCFDKHIAEKNTMLLLGPGMDYIGESLDDAKFILLVFDEPYIRCDRFSFYQLKNYLPSNLPCFRPLHIIEPVKRVLEDVLYYLDNKMYCRNLEAIKVNELFFLIEALYTPEENALFFAPLVDGKINFELLVKKKSREVNTVKELAEACNMSTKTFTRNFKKHFNTTPKQWMLSQKKQEVQRELMQSKDKIEVISNRLGFASGSHLGLYCKKYFRNTPTEIKKSSE